MKSTSVAFLVLSLLVIPVAIPQTSRVEGTCNAVQNAAFASGYVYGFAVMQFMNASNENDARGMRAACSSLKAMDKKLDSVKDYHLFDKSFTDTLANLALVRKACAQISE
jgi:hypothetical protein